MSYIQGTRVKIDIFVKHADTGDLYDPDDVIVHVRSPISIITASFTGGQVEQLVDAAEQPIVGTYRYTIDTTTAEGDWTYEVVATGVNEVRKQRAFDVRPYLTP